MKPAAFDYVRARTLEEALEVLAEGGDARALAGGQTLGPMLNLRLAMPSRLVDISGLGTLKTIEKQDSRLVIGACTTHAAIEDRSDASPTGSFLQRVASSIAYRAIRNRGTIGGSLAHADPAADWVAAMLALGARLTIARAAGTRTVAMHEFMRGAFSTAIQPMDLLQKIEIPELSNEARWGYYRVCRKTGDFPEAIGAIVLDPPRQVSRIVVGALDGAPLALPELAFQVAGAGRVTIDEVRSAVQRAAPQLDPVELQLHSVAVHRAIAQALSDG